MLGDGDAVETNAGRMHAFVERIAESFDDEFGVDQPVIWRRHHRLMQRLEILR
jgi:hypothetical protein